MALRAEAGNVERRYRNHCDAAGQRGDFIARTGAFHRDDDAAVGDVRKREARERRELGESARDDHVETCFVSEVLDALGDDANVRKRELDRGLLQERGLFRICVEQHDA